MFTYTQTATHTHTHKRPHTVTRTQTNTHGDAQGSTHLDRVHYTCKTLFYYMSTLTSTNDAIHIHYFCTRAHKYHHSYAHSCIAPSHIYTHSHMYANSQFTRIHSYPETPSFLITPLLTHAHPHTHTGLLVSYHYYGPGRGSWTAWTHPAPSGVTERSPPGGEAPQGGGGKHRGTRVSCN